MWVVTKYLNSAPLVVNTTKRNNGFFNKETIFYKRMKMTKDQLLIHLTSRYGELIGGISLSKALSYPTLDAMKRAIERDTLNIPTFFVKGRRGRFALTIDVVDWLYECRGSAIINIKKVPEQFKKK